MKHLNTYSALLLLTALCLSRYVQAQTDVLKQLEAIAVIEQKVMMPMRDGVRLATDVFRPKGDGRYPIIFSKTPYNFNSWGDGELRQNSYQVALDAVKRGYAYVVQNERGKFFSEGNWDILGPPTTDAYDAFTWMTKQPWSNGKIGLYGCSSTAEWQMAAASLGHPALAAMVPQGFGAGVGKVGPFMEQGNWYRGGAQQMLFTTWLYGTQVDQLARPLFPKTATSEDLTRVSRFYDLAPEMPKVDWAQGLKHLPVQDIIKNVNGAKGIYEKMIVRKPNDPDWYKGGLYHENMPFNVPSYWFVSWYDVSTGPNLALFNHVRKNATDPKVRDSQYLVIAPTLHCAYRRATENTIVGERSVGDARLDYDTMIYGWFDHWLKDDKSDLSKMPRVKYYTMGANKWQTSDTWPPANINMTTYYLTSNGRANSLYGDGTLTPAAPPKTSPADAFAYDPMYPVPSYGGNVCCAGNSVQGGSFDQHQMETRQDILVYTTEPFANGVELTGSIESTLYVGSDAKDTDFTVKLIDVYPDGKAYNLDETILRARYREGFDKEVWLEKGKVYKLDLSPMTTSNFFAPGHRIRIEVSSSNFPRFDRNMNTGGNNVTETKSVVAHNQIFHSAQYPSQVRLPIVRN
ncbi:CocE/NonD family hydrolase [Spirosoma sp. KUDC1026]|uniref:CocE/NonD family hydrolase n=1 Tax=Spirosoma sp. KUDC1026 TaxID=2745947 RepID=UPI00159BAAB2|nr:CocE/NonD family hydrolase [Spirosoma sp. KUDC1026]QKZ14689.1 CocE/NonD family hydrolase [Spirosoma sp. KUDC1026]